MAQIRVNTEDLHTKAKDFNLAADAFNRVGDDILAAAISMPSYEGQLSGPARKAGYEIQTQSRDVQTGLSGNAESLLNAARAFENVDKQIIDLFQHNHDLIIDANTISTLFAEEPKVGTSCVGYQDGEIDNLVIICMYGTCKRIQRSDYNKSIIAGFEAAVRKYNDDKRNRDVTFWAREAAYAEVAAAILSGVGVLAFGIILAQYAIADAAYRYFVSEMVPDTNNAAYYWNLLTGDSLDKDPNQDYDVTKPECSPIYDPKVPTYGPP